MRWVVALGLLVGCASQDTTRGYYWWVTISSPTPFDEIDVWQHDVGLGPLAILTPELLASGMPAPDGDAFPVGPGGPVIEQLAATTRTTFSSNSDTDGVAGVLVYAKKDGIRIGAAASRLDYVDTAEARHEAHVSLSVDMQPEEWELSGTLPPCVRSGTTYFVYSDDYDCDQIPNSTDCKPDAFCNRAATDPASIAACTCP
jgi:hypothetical protein